jgi:hypothetical protein
LVELDLLSKKDDMLDYYREMTDMVSTVTGPPEEYVWVMNEEHRRRYRYYLEHVMGLYPDDSESFGIGIMTGEPSNGQPFEIIRKHWEGC